MKISIITANYNGEKTLKRTIESILNQTYSKVEYIIVDGKSKDKSIELIKNFEDKFKEKKYELKWISEEDTGIFNAMNKGIKMSTGDIIGILGSDDWFEVNTLELVAREFEKKKDIKMVYGLLRTIKKNKFYEVKGRYDSYGKGQHPTVFLKKDIYEKYGLFNEKYKLAADAEFLLNLKKNKVKYSFIEVILANFSLEGASNKRNLEAKLEEIEICYIHKEFSRLEKIIRYIYIYIRYTIEKIIKR